MPPRVSVLLAVWNGLPHLREAVTSILDQSLADFEAIIVNDGSTDATARELAAVTDARCHVVTQPHMGLTRALNKGLARCQAPLIARLDADDVAHPDRLARQVAFFESHPEVGLLGTGVLERDGDREHAVVPPTTDTGLRWELIRRNPFAHSSVMMRRSALTAAGGYDERFPVAQDYDLWLRMSRVTRLACLPEVLVTRRVRTDSVSATRTRRRRWAQARTRLRAIAAGSYPWSDAVHVLRPLAGLLVPGHGRGPVEGRCVICQGSVPPGEMYPGERCEACWVKCAPGVTA